MSLERKYIKNQPLTGHQSTQKGSAILIIFVLIALFASLTYVFSSGSRTGTQQLSGEQARLAATEIIDYATKIKRAVQQLQIDGCSDTEISFENTITSGYTNPNAPTDNSCHIFHPNGGNLSYKSPLDSNLDSALSSEFFFGEIIFSNNTCINNVPNEEVGGANCNVLTADVNDLVMIYPYLKTAICTEVNKRISFNLPTGEAGQDNGSSFSSSSKLIGVYGPSTLMIKEAGYSGVFEACYESLGPTNPAGGSQHYYKVLIAR